VKTLYKLDLEPNEIYNVSLNIKQGNKTVDNLRFFQTQVPKLFNIKPANYTTYSQITEKPQPVVKTESGGGVSGGGNVTLNVTSVSWTEQKTGDFSEGELTSTPAQVTYNFTINLDGYPKMMGYQLSGFKYELSFLNYRNDYKPNGKTLTLSLTLSQIDPTAAAAINNDQTIKTYGLASAFKKGETRLHLSGNLKGIVPGNSMVTVIYAPGPPGKSAFPVPTYVTGYTPGTQYVTVSQPSIVAVPDTKEATFTSNAKFKGFTGNIYKYLKGGGSAGASTGLVKDATFVYQTFPTYSAPTYKYTFKKDSFIKSAVINPNVLDSLVWEDTVRDFIFFTIADDTVRSKNYFFGTYGVINASNENTAVTGDSLFNLDSPPSAPSQVITSNAKSFITSTPQTKFYSSGAITNATGVVPELQRAVQIRFAIARYTKIGSGWQGKWLGGSKQEEILSTPEVLE